MLLHALQHSKEQENDYKKKNVQCLQFFFYFLSGNNEDQVSIWIREDETLYSMDLITRKGHLSPCTA